MGNKSLDSSSTTRGEGGRERGDGGQEDRALESENELKREEESSSGSMEYK